MAHHPDPEEVAGAAWREAALQRHPQLKARMDALLKLVERADVELADEAERRTIDELRGLGQAVLQDWAHRREAQTPRPAHAVQDGKKKSTGTAPMG